jgi:hypothetical protein
MENLTKFQQDLINSLIKEFTKINPKPNNGEARFTFDTINNCLKEEERFKQTITKHNLAMIKLFGGQIKNDIKEFEKEFSSVLNIETGHSTYYSKTKEVFNSLEQMIDINTNKILSNNNGSECKLFFVSKSKPYSGSADNYFGKAYHQIYVDFKREKVSVILESGKEVVVYKIVGVTYNYCNWLNRNAALNVEGSTLDEFIQKSKSVQQKIITMAA